MNTLSRFLNLSILSLTLLALAGCNTVLEVVKDDPIETNPNQRTAGAKLDDSTIETIVEHNINTADTGLDDAHIEVHSFNGVVLLSGEVPTEELRSLALQTAQAVANVRLVHNELVIRGNSSFMSRTNDEYIRTKVRYNLSREEALGGTDMDVIVQDSVVFLMGLVNQEQGDVAAHSASLTSGVRRVVKVFEYVN